MITDYSAAKFEALLVEFFTKHMTTYWQQEQKLEMPTTQQILQQKCKSIITGWLEIGELWPFLMQFVQFLHPHTTEEEFRQISNFFSIIKVCFLSITYEHNPKDMKIFTLQKVFIKIEKKIHTSWESYFEKQKLYNSNWKTTF